jgi:hypothetical protein
VPARFHAALFAVALLAAGVAQAQGPVKVGVRAGVPFATVQPSGEVAGMYVKVLVAIDV